MEQKNWLKLSAYTSVEGLDALYNELIMREIDNIEVQDPRELEALLEDKMQYWDYIDDDTVELAGKPCITVYVNENSRGEQIKNSFADAVNVVRQTGLEIQVESSELHEEDWANNWKQYFKPIKVGEKLLIKPSWETIENDYGRTVLEIDPSVSFGTGGHATTRLCMEYLENSVTRGCEVLDMGCGSGILFVAAKLLGAGHVEAVDIEENAAATSKENADRNGITDYNIHIGNVLSDEDLCESLGEKRYDIILANIVADVIIAMSGLFTRYIKDGGILISSGIIIDRKDEVISAIKNAGFNILSEKTEGEWVGIMARYGSSK